MELDSDPMIPEAPSAPPPLPGQANPPPPCQTNAVKLCDLADISVRTFSTPGEDLVIQVISPRTQLDISGPWRRSGSWQGDAALFRG